MVFGEIAGTEAANFRNEKPGEISDATVGEEEAKLRLLFNPESTQGKTHSSVLIRRLRETMYEYVGVVRSGEGLEKAQKEIRHIRQQAEIDLKIVPGKVFNYDQIHAFELFNMLELGDAMVNSALIREE